MRQKKQPLWKVYLLEQKKFSESLPICSVKAVETHVFYATRKDISFRAW